jgi:hypothetical protein
MSAIFETEFRDLPMPEPDKNGKERHAKASSMKIVMLALADHANDDGEAWPGFTRLELKTGLSRQGVSDVMSALRYNGLIFINEEPSKSGTNFYTINIQCFPKLLGKEDKRLLVKPLDYPSQATLPEVVKPLDLNHHLTINKPSIASQEEKMQEVKDDANKEVDYILKISLSPKAIQDAVAKFFLLTPHWEGNKFNRQWMSWAMENDVTPAQIENAANLWKSDKRFNWQQPGLKGIQEHWLELRGKPPTQPKLDANDSPMSYG